MRYMGGKVRQAPAIRDFVATHKGARTNYVEPFIGGGSVFSAVASLFETATAGDVVPELIALWQDVHRGWAPPDHITEEHWRALRHDAPSAMKGWAAYAASYNGKYFGGYGPRASGRDYLAESQRAILKKVAAMPRDALFRCVDYANHAVDANTVIYCDPPYADTESYSGAGDFDHDRFWRTAELWVARGALVLVHEYAAPEGWTPVLVTDRVETMHTGKSSGVRKETLFAKGFDDQGKKDHVSTAAFFAAPNYGDGDREPARPKAVNPRTGKEQSWTRASTFASALKNPHGLIRWKMRDLVMGLSQRPDLCRMLLAGTPIEDKAKADEIITQAIGMMAPEAKANEGTAAHTALSRSWSHQDEMPEPEFQPLVFAFAAALKEHGLTPKATEQRVLNLAYNSMGNLDWVFEEADGTEVIGDVKTGDVEKAKREFSVQMAQYDGAEYLVHPDGTVEPIPWNLAHSHAVLVHIDLEHGNAVSVYRVDLNIGRYGAALAEQLRGWDKLDPLTPYVRPIDTRAKPLHHTQTSTAEPTVRTSNTEAAQVVANVTELPVAPELDHVAVAAEEQSDTSEDRFAHWMKLDKAPLQMELKKRGWTDDAHNRRWLARALVVLEQGWTDVAAIKKYAASKTDWSPETGHTEPAPEAEPSITERVAPVIEEGAQGPSTETLAHAIAGANSVGAIEALRADIVERRGDQAWTDALVAQARNRAYELGELPISEAATQAVFDQIRLAENQAALKDLWQRTTIGGSCGERWTAQMTEAGTARLAAIAAALPPAPANPFGD